MRQSTKRIFSALLSLLILFLASIIFIYFLRPTYDEIKNLQFEVREKTNTVNNQKILVEKFNKLNQDYKNQKDLQDIFSLILPNSPQVAEALIQINGLAENNNLNFISVNISKPTILSQVTEDLKNESKVKPVGSFDINLSLSGDYPNFKNFISQIENNIRLFNIKTININPNMVVDQKNKTVIKTLNYNITLTAFYQEE